jgi:regulatory protein
MRGYETEAINWVLSELISLGIQSDQRYAEAYTHMRTRKGFGPLRIQAELRHRGISDEIVQRVINKNDQIWLEQIQKVRQKKFGATIPRDFTIQAQQVRFLQSRGFSSEQIKQILRYSSIE